MKKYILFVSLILSVVVANAQGGYNYASLGIGAGVSQARPYADLKKNFDDYVYNVNFNFYTSPYVPVFAEIQFGKLRGGGNTVQEDASTRRFTNNFKAVTLNLNVQLGEMIDYENSFFLNTLKNFYFGSGIGAIFNNVDANRESLIDIGYVFPGKDKSVNLMVPLRFGYEFKINNSYGEPNIRLDLNYQHNLTYGEGLDGYDDSGKKFKNNALDQYRQISVGIKVLFGGPSSYGRSI